MSHLKTARLRHARSTNSAQAFSLIELLVVITIVSVLIAVLLPSLSSARTQAITMRCQANERQLIIPGYQYADDNRGQFIQKFHNDGANPSLNTSFTQYVQVMTRTYLTGQPIGLAYNSGTGRFSVGSGGNDLPKIMLCPANGKASTSWGGPWMTSYGFNSDHRGGWSRISTVKQIRINDVPKPSMKVYGMDWAYYTMRTDRFNSTGSHTFAGSYVPGWGAHGGTMGGGFPAEEYEDFNEGRHGLYVNVLYIDGHAATKSSLEMGNLWHNAGFVSSGLYFNFKSLTTTPNPTTSPYSIAGN